MAQDALRSVHPIFRCGVKRDGDMRFDFLDFGVPIMFREVPNDVPHLFQCVPQDVPNSIIA